MSEYLKVTGAITNTPPKKVSGDFDPQSQYVGDGVKSGGSKPTPQTSIMKRGSGSLSGSYPKNPQKLRG